MQAQRLGLSQLDLDIGSMTRAVMIAWKPPGHWLKANRDAYARSMEFLQNIVNGSSRMELQVNQQSLPRVLIQGASRRWYCVNTRVHYGEEYIDIDGEYREVKEVNWKMDIDGAAWKSDLLERTPFAVSLCMHPRRTSLHLPIGDQIAALALALQNDKTTGMRIPLLAQFIVSPRKALQGVYQFSEEGVIMEEEVYVEDEYEDDDIDAYMDDEMWALIQLFEAEELEHQAACIENQQYDAWVDRQENETGPDRSKNWHHDEDKIWQLEDNLRKGWR